MLSVEEISCWISLPKEMQTQVIRCDRLLDYEKLEHALAGLYIIETWNSAREELKELLGEDEDGSRCLTCMLHCLNKTYSQYHDMGISQRVFIDTMKCFSRFVKEHNESWGSYGFDRDYWTVRQISMQLFRIGELEYELSTYEGDKAISIHIPSDARMTKEGLRESYEGAVQFIDRYFPEYSGKVFYCNSWLLSPGLAQVLPEESNIRRFQQGFRIVDWKQEGTAFIKWVYKRDDIPYEELPEDTSLQRNLKHYILHGGKIGEALGVLAPDAE